MSLREINLEAPIFDTENKIIHENNSISTIKHHWESIDCCLVTPLHGGGVKARESDKDMPIRVTEIRGQLRFWWRLLAQQYQKQENNEIWKFPKDFDLRTQEFALWGGMSDGEEGSKASLVFLRVKIADKKLSNEKEKNILNRIGYTDYLQSILDKVKRPSKEEREEEQKKIKAALSYVLFTARGNKKQAEMELVQEGFEWTLQWYLNRHARCYNFEYDEQEEKWNKVSFKQEKYDTDLKQVQETLRWWINFGGIGGRTRRGCGAFAVNQSSITHIAEPLTKDDVKQVGCRLELLDAKDATDAWILAASRLQTFRQGVNVGRNAFTIKDKNNEEKTMPGRSRWSEPNIIRCLTNRHPSSDKHEHLAGKQFPRGMFGMPIIFQFKDDGEPKDTTLQPLGKKRMSSPLIIRPILQDGAWKAAALLLPYQANLPQVELVGSQVNQNATNPNERGRETVTLWDKTKAQHIKPIADNGGSDPLQAFMSYFAKPTK